MLKHLPALSGLSVISDFRTFVLLYVGSTSSLYVERGWNSKDGREIDIGHSDFDADPPFDLSIAPISFRSRQAMSASIRKRLDQFTAGEVR